jgi:GNAT superfamily N-acetyltransferase
MRTTKAYRITDLDEKNMESYFFCLEPGTVDIQEAVKHKTLWYDKMKSKGLGVKIAVNEEGKAVGMIQYLPSAYSPITGNENLYFINCIWIPLPRGKALNYRGLGIGKALLAAAEEDVKKRGAGGLVAWGLALPVFMRAAWFKKQGYTPVDKQGMQVLLWKPFATGLTPPAWVARGKTPPAKANPGKITITAFLSGACPVANFNYERVKKTAAEFGDKTCINTINMCQPKNIAEWGLGDAIFIEDKCISAGPPLSYKKIRAQVAGAVKKLGK